MTAIEFSAIPDTQEDYELLIDLLAGFRKQTGIEVKFTRMAWTDAWQQLINISTHGQGADISHVGSTWVSSLVSMNSLRPIPSHVVTKIGSEDSFVHAAWNSVITEDDRNPWAIPLSTLPAKTPCSNWDADLRSFLPASMPWTNSSPLTIRFDL